MKRKITTLFLFALMLVALGTTTTSCSSDSYTDYGEIQRMIDKSLDGIPNANDVQKMIDKSLNGQWKIVNIMVKKEDWMWNKDLSQFECKIELPELTESIFKEGAILGYIIFDTDNVQKMLPWTNTYSQDVNGQTIIFSETIGYDVQYLPNNKSNVLFTIKASDLAKDDYAPQTYKFRIVLIW